MNAGLERLIGGWLRSVRGHDGHLASNDARIADAPETIRLISPAFDDGSLIPQRYAGAGIGDNLSPPLAWSNVPLGTKELVLILQDPDAPLPRPVVHLIAIGLPLDAFSVPEGFLTPGASRTLGFGRGFMGRIGYTGPRPVLGHGPHRYVFQLFALSQSLGLAGTPGIDAVMDQVASSVLARGKLTGVYERV